MNVTIYDYLTTVQLKSEYVRGRLKVENWKESNWMRFSITLYGSNIDRDIKQRNVSIKDEELTRVSQGIAIGTHASRFKACNCIWLFGLTNSCQIVIDAVKSFV
jgi:hypothetical protein